MSTMAENVIVAGADNRPPMLERKWSKFVTDVKLTNDMHNASFDQLYAYLRQHEEKILLAQAQEARVILGEEQLAFLADTWERVDSGLDTQALTTIAVFQIDDLDAFDLNCDKAPSASVVLMDKLSAYDSDVLSEVVHLILWYLDSGCSKHMTEQRSQLINFVIKFMGIVRFRNDQVAAIMRLSRPSLGFGIAAYHI
uniref:Integrase, catalytic region, zinc finger, CCHC-type, peptidase aspartic, catalytic n=1 Tax=Tanacetum cinerariifolium TaxID=118510 RepID=A0A6L2NC81_TANCI|nr:integrase, catalytic region, zinc finger, CCHC-type, peptidase aspartic, catalytic [Tanacetum cinerariifolium]